MNAPLKAALLFVAITASTTLTHASGISYTCGTTIGASTCGYLNTTISGLYSSTFTNANASIYIDYNPAVGLGQSSQYTGSVSYSVYQGALAAQSTDFTAVASLPGAEPGLYSGANVQLTSALGQALGIGNVPGLTTLGNACTLGSAGCFNALVELITPSVLLANNGQGYYYRIGAQGADDYDFYSVVEHETDEALGTSSCIGGNGTDGCGANTPSATDLFRYNGNGSRVLIDATNAGNSDYFSANGGATVGSPFYSALGDGGDYADYSASCIAVQDSGACTGQSFDITTDPGRPEIATLNAVGYNLVPTALSATPEPSSLLLLGTGIAGVANLARRRRKG